MMFKRTLAIAALAAVTALPLPALAHNVLIVNPLPNRVWVTVYANGNIHWSGWVKPELRYETRQAAPTFQAEVAAPNDHSVHPRIICKTRTSFSSSDRRTRITINLNTANNSCWWS